MPSFLSSLAAAVLGSVLATATLVPPAAAQGSGEIRFAVSAYRVDGDNPLPPAATQALLAPYTGDSVGIDRLQAAAAALEARLREDGYAFLRVVVPPQDAQGVIRLRVLAFRLDTIRVSGQRGFTEANLLRSLPSLQPGATPNLRDVARNQAHVNDHPAKQIAVTMQPGRAGDTVDAEVRVQDEEPLQVFASLNNTGTPSSGLARLSFGVSHSNLFDRDHQLTATYTTAPQHPSDVSQFGFHYRAPFYGVGGTLAAYYTRSDTNSGTVADFFTVSGRGEFMGLRWSQRLAPVAAYSHLVEIGLEDRLFENNVAFNGAPIGVDVRSRPLLLRYEGRYDGAGYGVRGALEFAHNVAGGSANDAAGYTGNRAGATRDWNALRYTFDASKAYAGWIASARLRGQTTNDALIPGEQFGLGGASLVRGLDEREATGDRGHVATLEITTPPVTEGVRLLAFADTGAAQTLAAGGAAGSRQHATSAGLGVRWQWRRQLSVAADWAYVFDGAASTRSGDNRFHLALSWRF